MLLAVLALGSYWNTLQNGFVWDDTLQILQNPYLAPGTPWLQLFTSDVWAFAHPTGPAVNNYYRPLQMLTYRLTAELFGLSASAFHALPVGFHVLATLLAYLILFRLTRRVGLAAAAAALFAVHPIHTEAVAWISALPDLGCTVFFLLSFNLFLLANDPEAGSTGSRLPVRRLWLWGLSAACFAVAFLWKEMAVTLPVVIALYVVMLNPGQLPHRPLFRRAMLSTLPYWAALAAYLPLRYHALGYLAVSQRNWILSPADYILTVIDLVARYWWKLLLPVHLNAYHVFDPVRSLAEPRALGAILFLVVAGAAVAYGYRRAPLAAFGALWVFLTLIPVLNLRGVGRNVLAERYLYLPSFGFCLLVVWLASKGLAHLPDGNRSWVGAGALTVVGALCLAQTVERNAVWKDQFTLFSQTLEASPDSPDMENALADVLRSEKGDLEGAENHYQRAITLAQSQNPPELDQVDSAGVGLALIYGARGDFNRALDALDKAQAANPGDPAALSARGGILLQMGRWQEARDTLLKARAANPNDVNVWNGLGFIAWQNEHQYAQAVDDFQRALALRPPSDLFQASIHNSLGAVYCEMERCAEGVPHFQRAIQLSPNDPQYHTNLGNAFTVAGRYAEARAELETALALSPGYAPAQAALANLQQRTH